MSYLLISYPGEQRQTTPRLTYSAWRRAEARVNYKGKAREGKVEPSGWKPNGMKRKEKPSLNILIKNARRWRAARGKGQVHSQC